MTAFLIYCVILITGAPRAIHSLFRCCLATNSTLWTLATIFVMRMQRTIPWLNVKVRDAFYCAPVLFFFLQRRGLGGSVRK